MKSLQSRLTAANSLLAPYAVPHGGLLGRTEKEPEDETRFPFQRDRGRLVHSQAFRRLQGKTQVFVVGESDHYRTRLTHTMEVAQLSRDIARTLGLNEDLAECIALAHDLGHPPFGHRGEAALDTWMRDHGSSFEHNEQSLRIVTVLEEHAQGRAGLNLHQEILEGLQKHRAADAHHPRSLSLEAQVVNVADEIAYSSHDCDDGVEAGLFSLEDLQAVPLAKHAQVIATLRRTSLRGALMHAIVLDLYAETDRRIAAHGIRSLDDVYAATESLVGFSEKMQADIHLLKAFLQERMYRHPRVVQSGDAGQQIIWKLCTALEKEPGKLAAEKHGASLPERIKDYVAGMTDAFARTQVEALESGH